ncbi:hypothetical protein BGW38_000941 [Lunasporangiospora selenospora]|uniref:Pentatricopeptide repeat protein n=1 Tax=Lunasporangiospora selenospora TaxID=979761 RepID=A0A9P6FUS2_9FUNG|nr:hypothetical protein BGW38_000941 [Lunasporangiospora selenospora]
MSQLTTLFSRRAVIASKPCQNSVLLSTSRHYLNLRHYSRKRKTNLQVATEELERDIRQLEQSIVDFERKLSARKSAEASIRESDARSNAARNVYESIKSPITQEGASSSTPGLKAIGARPGPYAQSALPETFLRDLKLTFTDTRGARQSKIQQIQSEILSSESRILPSAIALDDLQGEDSTPQPDQSLEIPTPAEATTTETDGMTLEHIKKIDIERWNQLIYVNALEGNVNNVEETMRLMEELGIEPDLETFDYLMEAYYFAGNLEKAQGVIETMLKSSLVPTISAFNSLLKIHVKQRDLTGAFKVFEALKEHHRPNTEVFTTLVRGCLRAGEFDLGWKVFNQMQVSGATPSESTYSLMIHACAKTDQVEKALDIFRSYPSRKLQPTDITFNCLIHACAVRPEYFVTAFALLNEMETVYGFEADILTYNTLLFACSKKRDLITARRIFQKVIQLDSEGALELDGVTVSNFLWCITEWKDLDTHHRNYKHKLWMKKQQQIEPSQEQPISALEDNTAEKSIAPRPAYFVLSSKPPKDETEALAEGESVFSWFLSRSAERSPFTEDSTEARTEADQTRDNSEDSLENEGSVVVAPKFLNHLPKVSAASQVRTRVLNAYLGMIVRHQDPEKATEIYRNYYDHFGRVRDSWTHSIMLEWCYTWKDVRLGTEVFRNWRAWRESTGLLTDKRTRKADYKCYRLMINLLARTNHLDESIALLEELSIAATPTNTRLRAEISSASKQKAIEGTFSESSTTTELENEEELSESLAFLQPIKEETVLPIHPKLKDFALVYNKTWAFEDVAARKLVLRLCHGSVDNLYSSTTRSAKEGDANDEEAKSPAAVPSRDKVRERYERSQRKTSIKWKGEHPQEKGFYMSDRRFRELDRDAASRNQGRRR